jgi:hypothetical protein
MSQQCRNAKSVADPHPNLLPKGEGTKREEERASALLSIHSLIVTSPVGRGRKR